MISLAQLREAGLGRGAVQHRVRTGRLRPLHRTVYLVGGATLGFRGRLWAAVLATGGIVSHWSAAAAWDLLPAPSGPVHVIGRGRSTAKLRVHRCAGVDAVHQDDGLPLTTPMRTVYDLAPSLTPHRLERLCHRAELLRLLDARALDALPARRDLRAALARFDGPAVTRSELEERFLELVAEAGLPQPLVNSVVAGYEVDFFWPGSNLAVETDGAAAHLTRTAFEADRRRDAELQTMGVKTVRVTDRWMRTDPATVIATLRQLAS